jgi:hypothetical protein
LFRENCRLFKEARRTEVEKEIGKEVGHQAIRHHKTRREFPVAAVRVDGFAIRKL